MVFLVKTAQGEVQGEAGKTHAGQEYARFLGLPYAAPPLGARRFARPEPPPSWQGVRKADKTVAFVQMDDMFGDGKVKGTEDALTANIYTPASALAENAAPLPVMFYLHGGAFCIGDSGPGLQGPAWLLDHGVVMVAVNYRLGALGFLSTGDDVIPANLGLWDMRQALLWTRDNISQFGGDPTNVTIFGESAGGFGVGYLLLSPQCCGLFHRAILQSGTPFNAFCRMDKHPAHVARKLVKALGGPQDPTSKDILEFLRRVEAKEILEKTQKEAILGEGESVAESGPNPGPRFLTFPVVDNFCSDPFLPEDPVELLRKGKFNQVPIIVGFNKDEGVFVSPQHLKLAPGFSDRANTNLKRFAANKLFNRDLDEADSVDLEVAGELLQQAGLTAISQAPEEASKFGQMLGDAMFVCGTMEFSRMVAAASSSPVYQYRFSYPTPFTLKDLLPGASMLKIVARSLANSLFKWDVLRDKHHTDVCHTDETSMIFQFEGVPIRQRWSTTDFQVSETMLRMWTNFAKDGNPTPNNDSELSFRWEQLAKGSDLYLDIGQSQPRMFLDPREAAFLAVWREQLVARVGLHLGLARSTTRR